MAITTTNTQKAKTVQVQAKAEARVKSPDSKPASSEPKDSYRSVSQDERKETNEMDKMRQLRAMKFGNTINSSSATSSSVKSFNGNSMGNSSTVTENKDQVKQRVDSIVNRHVGTIYNDNAKIGSELASTGDHRVINGVLDRGRGVTGSSGDDISYETTRNMSDRQIQDMAKTPDGLKTLRRMRDEMGSGIVTEVEKNQIKRLADVAGNPQDHKKSVEWKGEIPNSLQKAYENGKLDLSQVTPEMVKGLSAEEKKNLMGQLKGSQVTVVTGTTKKDDAPIYGNEKADQYLINTLAGKDKTGQTATELFANASTESQGNMKLSKDAAKGIVNNLPVVTRAMAEQNPNDRMTKEHAKVISNIAKHYPMESQEDVKALALKMDEAAKELPQTLKGVDSKTGQPFERDQTKYNQGWLTGAVLQGFREKGDEFKEQAAALDLMSEGVDLLGLKTPIAVGLKAGIKVSVKALEGKAEGYDNDARDAATDITRVWAKNTSDENDLTEMREGLVDGARWRF